MDHTTPLFARQPIFDAHMNVVAHELLFRCEATTGAAATAEVLLSAFDHSLFDAASANLPMFVNFPEQILMDMPHLDKSRLVVEILENVKVTPHLVSQVKTLRDAGYRIALDDYVHAPEFAPLLEIADIIKLDVLGMTAPQLSTLTQQLRSPGRQLLAEKVETHAVYQQCCALGMDYYQGFFFAKPDIVYGKSVSADAATIFNLLAALQKTNMTAERLEQIVLSDTVLTYRIIKLVNSAGYRRANEITSVAGAISMLGYRRISAFASLVSLGQLQHKPKALGVYSALRANFCQRLGQLLKLPLPAESIFALGVLSCVDAYFDQPIEQLTQNLPIHADFKEALLHRAGTLGLLLDICQHYQEGTWEKIDWLKLQALGVNAQDCDVAYAESLAWLEDNKSALTSE